MALALLAAAASAERTARASGPGAADSATAQALFEEGKRLMDAGQYAQACPKLADSQRLDPGIGTLLNLGVCLERNGQTASAWAVFKDAAGQAHAAGQTDREGFARERAARLEPSLARVAVVVPPESAVDGLVVKRDGEAVPATTWGLPVPVDPGAHVVEASAPARKAWSASLAVAAASTSTVTVPVLESAAAAPPAPPPAPPPGPPPPPPEAPAAGNPGSAQRVWAVVAGGVGVVGMGVGVALGVAAKNQYRATLQPIGGDPECSTGGVCTGDGYGRQSDAQKQANVATGVFIAGAAVAAAGVTLYLTAPRARPAAGAVLRVDATPGGAVLRGAW